MLENNFADDPEDTTNENVQVEGVSLSKNAAIQKVDPPLIIQDGLPVDSLELLKEKYGDKDTSRPLAKLLSIQGGREVYCTAVGKKVPYREYLAMMLWDLVTSGTALFIDGTKLEVSNMKEWSEVVKFLHAHIDGAVPQKPDIVAGGNIIIWDLDQQNLNLLKKS